MTTDTKPDNTTENTENSNPEIEDQAAKNKAVFGPLGKYAVIAVIMVSIIVTTAIMFNKELGSSEEKIAATEEEVSDMAPADVVATASVSESTATVEVAKTSAEDVTTTTNTTVVSVPSAATAETQETIVVAETSTNTAISDSPATTETENDRYTGRLDARQAQLAAQFQARIEAHKLEQKQRMTEMFVRIKEQEAQQLDRYKSSQDTQVERLREQIAKQQQMIDTLISRNKELYELRAANVQQYQTRREEMINRI